MFKHTRFSFVQFSIPLFLLVYLLCFLQCQTNQVPHKTAKQNMMQSSMKETTTSNAPLYLYVGTYTRKEGHVDGKAKGIYVYKMNPKTGELLHHGEIGGIINPSYLTIHPNRKYLYAISETGDGESATVNSYSIDPTTKQLTALNQVAAVGYAPCYISVEQSGKYAMVANYTTGNVVMLPIGADGHLQAASDNHLHNDSRAKNTRPRRAHAHSIVPDPNNRFAISAELAMDLMYVYEMDLESGKLIVKDIEGSEAAAGPRHLDFHPTLPKIYSINELNGTINVWDYDGEKGDLTLNNTYETYPNDHSGSISSADIHVHPSGKFLYASNRAKLNNIVVFQIDSKTGDLTFVESVGTQGKTPRNFVISPDGRFLLVANQDSSTVVVFSIDSKTGKLTPTGEVEEIMSPVCLKFL